MSQKQIQAKVRNFKILRLRGLYCTAKNLLPEKSATKVCILVDNELDRLGAEKESYRSFKRFVKNK